MLEGNVAGNNPVPVLPSSTDTAPLLLPIADPYERGPQSHNGSCFQDVLDQAVHLDESHHHHPQPKLLLLRQAEHAQRRSDHRVPVGHSVRHSGNQAKLF